MPREMEVRWVVRKIAKRKPVRVDGAPQFGKRTKKQQETETETAMTLQQFIGGEWRDVPVVQE